jgi:predicted NAD-dependent protein-ADP-ribosyltransferase YbiA (DUF1768 family)
MFMFSGLLSPLSNFLPVELRSTALSTTVEQYYQHAKAVFVHDKNTAFEILIENEPAHMKRLGDQLKVDQTK